MKRNIGIAMLTLLVAVGLAATRVYDVDVRANAHGWTAMGTQSGVRQTFACTADSLLWAEFFVGAASTGGYYAFDVYTYPDLRKVFEGMSDTCNPGMQYSFVRGGLHPYGSEKLIKGEEYVLKVTHSGGDSINYYAGDLDDYQYGEIEVPGKVVPDVWDLACRIEGVNRAVSREFFGANSWYTYAPNPPDSSSIKYAEAESAGCSWIRELLRWDLVEWTKGTMNWTPFDSAIAQQYRHGLQTLTAPCICPTWASSHIDSVRQDSANSFGLDTFWSATCPPRGLYEPVDTIINDSLQVNPANYWGNLVYQFVMRYKHGSAFWSTVDANGGIDYIECSNEPGYWKTPNLDTILYPDSYGLPSSGDSIELVERLYARLCDVTMEAVHLAGQSGVVKVLVGSLGGVELEQVGADRLVKGKDWLRKYYQYRESTGTCGVTVHPYQYGYDTAVAFMPSLFAQNLDTIRAIMQANDEGGKPLWATELGYDQGGDDTMVTALSIPECYLAAMAGIKPRFYDRVMLFVLESFEPPYNTASALLGDSIQDFARRPSFYAYRQMTQELAGRRVNGRVLSGDSATDAKTLVYELQDTASGKKTWVGWRNYGTSGAAVSVTIPARTSSLGQVSLALAEQRDSVQVQAATSGWLSVALGDSAVYVRETGDTLRPDLRIDSVWTSFVPGPVWPQQRRFHAKVHNVGTAFSPAQDYNSTEGGPVNFYANGQLVAHASHMAGIMDGEAIGVESDDPWEIADTGSYLVRAAVNESRTFVELGFDNNSRYRLFQILPVYKADGGANGARAMARATSSSPIQAVAEFVEGGKPMVYYCPSLDSAASDWYSLAAGNHAALSLDAAGNPWAVCTRGDSSETLFAMVRRADTTWTRVVVTTTASGQHLGAPALAVFHNQGNWRGPYACLGNVAFTAYSSQTGTPPSCIVHCRFDTVPGQVFTDTVDVGCCAAIDSCVSLCSGVQDTLHLAYQCGNAYWSGVNYRTARYDTACAVAMSWSAPAAVNSTTLDTRHPYIDLVADRLHCVYRQQDLSDANQPISIARSVHFSWGSPGDWFQWGISSRIDGNPKDCPMLSGEHAVAWSEDVGAGNWEVLARVGMCPDTIANLSRTSAASKCPRILADSVVGYSPSNDLVNVHCLWTEHVAGDTNEVNYQTTPVAFARAAPNATRYNNGHKLLLDGDTLRAVFCASDGSPCGGIVGYATLAPGGADWTRSFPMGGDVPSIGRDTSGTVWIVGRGIGAMNIMVAALTPGGGWTPQTILWCPPYEMESTEVGVPSIAGAKCGRYLSPTCPNCYTVFPVYNHVKDSSFIVMIQATPWSIQRIDTIDRAGIADDSFPSIGVLDGNYLHVTWQRGSRVYAKTGADTSCPTLPIDWSPSFAISDTDSTAMHPTIEASADTILAAWSEGTPGRIRVRCQLPADAFDAWGSSITVSDTSSYDCDYPTVSIGDTVVIGYQRSSGTGTDAFVNVQFAENYQVTSGASPAAYGHVVYQRLIQDGDTQHVAHCIWAAEPSSGFYDVGYTAFVLPTGGGGGGMSAGIFDPGIKPMLFAPAPNPFNGLTTIRYQTNIKGMTRVTVMDITGRRVRNLLTVPQSPGIYNLTWNARDDRARQLSRGIYFVRLETPNYHEARKLILTE